jgi:hypothetical protein
VRPGRSEDLLSECYRASAEPIPRWDPGDRVVLSCTRSELHEICEVAGLKQSAKQVSKVSISACGQVHQSLLLKNHTFLACFTVYAESGFHGLALCNEPASFFLQRIFCNNRNSNTVALLTSGNLLYDWYALPCHGGRTAQTAV